MPARFDDELDVRARCVELRGARFRYEYAIVRADGVLLADGWTNHACVDARDVRADPGPDGSRTLSGRLSIVVAGAVVVAAFGFFGFGFFFFGPTRTSSGEAR